ncbi:MAG: nucleotidyltransferase family protein [Kangiellaceae bacterium]|nr:nucleotidyltransferase family protein [Kangiellaceae bacterium]
MRALSAVRFLAPPDWLIAAGFVRNCLWDSQFQQKTPLNDIDVIYFCPDNVTADRDLEIEHQLQLIAPYYEWSVKNQARMHCRNGDKSYLNSLDAMSYWPEKQTAIGVKLNKVHRIEIAHCFDLELQFNKKISRNPVRSVKLFEQRVASKKWLQNWPDLEREY